jgi:hypothetical protein
VLLVFGCGLQLIVQESATQEGDKPLRIVGDPMRCEQAKEDVMAILDSAVSYIEFFFAPEMKMFEPIMFLFDQPGFGPSGGMSRGRGPPGGFGEYGSPPGGGPLPNQVDVSIINNLSLLQNDYEISRNVLVI